jgi:hypothetical protein
LLEELSVELRPGFAEQSILDRRCLLMGPFFKLGGAVQEVIGLSAQELVVLDVESLDVLEHHLSASNHASA